jgi:hypothetical protein
MDLPLLLVYLVVVEFNLLAVPGSDGNGEFFLQRLDPGFYPGFVQALHLMMNVGVDVQCLADGNQQMLFVQLRIPLHRFMLDALGDLPEFGHGFLFEFDESMLHGWFLQN